jgi:hypothetical protein
VPARALPFRVLAGVLPCAHTCRSPVPAGGEGGRVERGRAAADPQRRLAAGACRAHGAREVHSDQSLPRRAAANQPGGAGKGRQRRAGDAELGAPGETLATGPESGGRRQPGCGRAEGDCDGAAGWRPEGQAAGSRLRVMGGVRAFWGRACRLGVRGKGLAPALGVAHAQGPSHAALKSQACCAGPNTVRAQRAIAAGRLEGAGARARTLGARSRAGLVSQNHSHSAHSHRPAGPRL